MRWEQPFPASPVLPRGPEPGSRREPETPSFRLSLERSHSVFGIPQDMFDWIKKLSEVGRDDPHPFLDGFTSLSPRQMERNESPQARALHRPTGLLLLDETERRPGLSVDHSKYASVQARINRLTGESPCRRRGRRTNGAMTSNSS